MDYSHLEKMMPHDYILRPLTWLIPSWVRPNHITLLRFILTPFVIWLILSENYAIGIPLFIITACTDALDGTLARIRKQVTEWGIFYDPIADKILVSSVLLITAFKYINVFIVLGIIAMEFSIVFAGLVRNKKKRIVAANAWGKTKMFMEFSGLLLLLITASSGNVLLIPAVSTLFLIAILLGSISLITYSL